MRIIMSLVFIFSSYAGLSKSFYKHEKKIEQRKKEKLSVASGLRAERAKREELRRVEANKYKKIREKQLKAKEKKEKRFKTYEQKRKGLEAKRLEKAKTTAQQKRRKENLNWKDQNREFGIDPPKTKKDFSNRFQQQQIEN